MNNRHENKKNQVDLQRRSILRKTVIASAALAGCSIIPDKWTTPLVEFGSLPAHASTSGLLSALVNDFKPDGVASEDPLLKNSQATVASAEPQSEVQATVAPAEPQEEMYGYTHKEVAPYAGQIHISGNYYSKYFFSRNGTKYGKSFLLRWSDGKQLYVFDSRYGDGYIIGPGGRKYVAGKPVFKGKDAGHNMEAYAALGTKPRNCTVYYNG